MATNALSINLYLGKRDELAVINAARDAAEEVSKQTVKDINHAIPILVATSEKNAVENYKRRYGVGGNAPVGPICVDANSGNGFHFGRLWPYTGSGKTDVPKDPSGTPVVVDASGTCDPRFINDAARAAAIMHGIDLWIDANTIPREK